MTAINQQAPVSCQKEIVINSNIEKVWQVLTDINNWPTWNHEVNKAKLCEKLQPLTIFKWKTGGISINSELHTVEPFNNFGWTGKSLGTFAIHNWTLTEKNGKTLVFVEESMEGFLVRLFKSSFKKNLENGMQKWLDFLKLECEK